MRKFQMVLFLYINWCEFNLYMFLLLKKLGDSETRKNLSKVRRWFGFEQTVRICHHRCIYANLRKLINLYADGLFTNLPLGDELWKFPRRARKLVDSHSIDHPLNHENHPTIRYTTHISTIPNAMIYQRFPTNIRFEKNLQSFVSYMASRFILY